MPWDPEQYRKFESERFAPFGDSFALISVRPRMRVIDLGCGTGELTARLAERLPRSDVLGIDASAEMLAEAQKLARPGLRFEQREIQAITEAQSGDGWDLVFSHAALQWVDDHAALIPRVFELVAPQGQLAVQVPSNHEHPSHLLIRETAAEEPFRATFGGWTRASPVLTIEMYAAILYAEGATELTVVEKVYPHVLADSDAMAEWVKGTALVPYLERLPAGLREEFIARYREKLAVAFREAPVFYPFRRTLFVATRPA